MSKVACWGCNNTFQCSWVIFGYGSRWDMSIGNYYRGWWIGEEALKILLYYDYHINPKQEDWKPIYFESPILNYDDIIKISGGFIRDNQNYSESFFNNEFKIPSLESIKKINQKHWDIINRIQFMDRNAFLSSLYHDKLKFSMATDDDMKQI